MKPVLVLGAFALAALNAPTASAQQRPPIRQIGAVIAKSSDSLTSIAGVRALSDGRLLVNDIQGRRVLLLDATLKTAVVVADSTSATGNAYGGRLGGLIAYRGDSTLFVDPFSSSMLVIEPMGKIGRVMSIPRTQDAAMLANPSVGAPGFDTKGRLVYRQFPSIRPPAFGPNGITGPPAIPESTAIVRVDLATRQLDTVGFAKIPKIKMDMQVTENGGVRISTLNNPLPIVDDWAILPDGSVAFIRGTDYHVDFVNADGTRTSAPKIPFDWQRLTDDDKVAFIDSVKAARARLVASLPAGGAGPAGVIGGLTGGGGTPQIVIQGGPGAGPAGRGSAGGGPGQPTVQIQFIPPSELPDYKPPFFAGATRVDRDGNLWIHTIPTKAIAGGPVYDVINRKGELVERVQVPEKTSIVGFGENGTVILVLQDNRVSHLETAHIR